MNGVLVGFRIEGIYKLQRLHGLRSCEEGLKELLSYLRGVSDSQLLAYASQVTAIGPEQGPFLSEAQRCQVHGFMTTAHTPAVHRLAWSDAFAAFRGLEAWHAGFPYLPAAPIDLCADIHWCFLLDLDLGQLQIYDNRNARFSWRAMGFAEPAFCTLSLQHARLLRNQDINTLHSLLQQHVCSDGRDPVLPMSDAVSASFAGPGQWRARVELRGGRVRLLLARDTLEAQICRVAALRLDDPGCGEFLRQALDPQVLALSKSIYGSAASLAQIDLVASQRQLLAFDAHKGGLPLLDLGLRTSTGLQLRLGPDYFDSVRVRLMSNGLTAQGWRFLIKQDNEPLRVLLQFFPPSAGVLPGFAYFINLLASALQSEPLCARRGLTALRGVERILDRTRGRPEPVREENARIYLRAIMRARLSEDEESNLDHEAQDVSDFVYSQHLALKGASWRSLCRRSDLWHRQLLIKVDPATDVRWPALLPRHALGSFDAIELDSGALLAEEGLEQRHCIGSYVNACSSGASRVFSLRQNGRRLATIELQRGHDGDWRLVQIRGKANSLIRDTATLEAAESLALAYSHRVRLHEKGQSQNFHPALQPGAYVAPAYVVHRQDHWTG